MFYRFCRSSLLCLATVLLSSGLTGTAQAQVTVYTNNFQGGSTAGFSNGSISSTPGTVAHATDMFLGEFGGSNSTTLTLTGLAAHTTATINFDLYMIRSPDGDGPQGGGADGWSLTGGGNTLLSTTFANYPGNTQQFQSQANPNAGGQAPYTGSTEQNTLGYTFNGGPMDSVYHFSYTFANTAGALSFVFGSSFNEDITNESWGIDNVVVQTNASTTAATPEPGSVALLIGMGLSGTGLVIRRRRKLRQAHSCRFSWAR